MSAGFDPARFWDLTFSELDLIFEAAGKRAIRERNERAWSVWHIAAFQRVKKLPRLQSVMINDKPPEPVSWEVQLAAWQAYAARQTHH